MQLLFPGFLWALAILAIPILIHLFYFRRFKKVYFTNVRFLKEIKQETSNRNRLKNILILLSRLLALAFLIGAFAQPFLPNKSGISTSSKTVSVFVDNSFSMASLSEDVPLFEQAKKKASEIINAYSEQDKFQILTHDFFGRHQRFLTKEDALQELDNLVISPEVKSLEQILTKQNLLHSNKVAEVQETYVISDFQNSIVDPNVNIDTSINHYFLPIQSIQDNNVALDSAWFLSPTPMLNSNNQVVVKISNYSNNPVENIRLSLNQDGQIRPFGLLNIDANRSVYDTVNIALNRPGVHQLSLEITDYPIQFDDKYLLSFNVPEKINVLEIFERNQSKYLDALFDGLNYFELNSQPVKQVKYGELASYNLIILNDLINLSTGLSSEIKKYLEAGGNVLYFPGKGSPISDHNNFLNTVGSDAFQNSISESMEVKKINTGEFVFSDVFEKISNNMNLPVVKFYFDFNSISRNKAISLLSYRDGNDYLRKYNISGGQLYVCSAPLSIEQNDLAQKAEVFVPLIYKSALSQNISLKPSFTIGKDESIRVKNKLQGADQVYKFKAEEEFIPGQRNLGNSTIIELNNSISKAGIYSLMNGDEVVESLAFNYNRAESNLEYQSIDDLREVFGESVDIYDNVLEANFSEIIQGNIIGKHFWKYCLLAALLFLLIESLLIRFWR